MVVYKSITNWNEDNLNPLLRINWRASLVPAAAVIPAPIANTNFVAVKTLVVGFFFSSSFILFMFLKEDKSEKN